MQVSKRTVLLLFVASVLGTTASHHIPAARGARLIRFTVHLDGKLLLETSTSDNGNADADEVWNYLNEVAFAPTDEFEQRFGNPGTNGEELLLVGPKNDATIKLTVAYGGVAETRKLKLIRKQPDSFGRVWTIAPEEIKRNFRYRMITRAAAAQLKRRQLPDG